MTSILSSVAKAIFTYLQQKCCNFWTITATSNLFTGMNLAENDDVIWYITRPSFHLKKLTDSRWRPCLVHTVKDRPPHAYLTGIFLLPNSCVLRLLTHPLVLLPVKSPAAKYTSSSIVYSSWLTEAIPVAWFLKQFSLSYHCTTTLLTYT